MGFLEGVGEALPGVIGGWLGMDKSARDAEAAGDKNAEIQRQFAQHGIRWRVEDAKQAGIHPLAALGASTQSFSPSYVGGDGGNIMAQMGQDVSRAIHATRSSDERTISKLQIAGMEADLRGKELDNQLRASQLQKIGGASVGPGMPTPMDTPTSIPGQSGSGVVIKPAQVTASRAGVPAQQAGGINDYGFTRTNTGLSIVPSSDVKERIEDQMIPELMWAFRNQLLPNFGTHPAPDPREFKLPAGYDQWKWNHMAQEFQPYNSKRNYFKPY